jgi:HD-like signal output (HDOD) protein
MDAKLATVILKKMLGMKVSVFSTTDNVLKRYQKQLISSAFKPENISLFNDYDALIENFSGHLLFLDSLAWQKYTSISEPFIASLSDNNVIIISLVSTVDIKRSFDFIGQHMDASTKTSDFKKTLILLIAQALLSQKQKKQAEEYRPSQNSLNGLVKRYCSTNLPSQLELKSAFDAIKGISMPTMPEMALKVQKELSTIRPDMKKVADFISKDAGLSGSVLKIINSAAFDLKKKITSIEHASVLLGTDKIKNTVIASAFKNVSSFGEKNKTFTNQLSLESSVLAFCCARLSMYVSEVTQDEAYMAGLFHNGGLLILSAKYSEMKTLLESNIDAPTSLIKKEYDLYFTSHTVVGYLLGQHWQLPDVVTQSIYCHHASSPEKITDETLRGLVSILITANNILQNINGQPESTSEESKIYYGGALTELMIDDEILEQIEIDTNEFMHEEMGG